MGQFDVGTLNNGNLFLLEYVLHVFTGHLVFYSVYFNLLHPSASGGSE